jgi:4a-hydroxytetrahydrobiopterin dehydratase
VDIEDTLHGFEVASDPFALGTRHLHLRGRADRYAGAEPADGQADATEPTAEAAIEIQKAEMQPCRNCNGNVRGGRGAVQPLSPEIFPQPGFSNQNTAIYCGASRLFAISDELPNTLYRRWHAMTERIKESTYSDEQITERLQRELPHWYLEGGWIRRKYRTHSWKGTLMVINAVGHLAEAAWHHPDITASYAWVEIRLQNHAAKGITDKDFELAKKIEEMVHWQPGKESRALEGTPEKDQRFAYIKYDI